MTDFNNLLRLLLVGDNPLDHEAFRDIFNPNSNQPTAIFGIATDEKDISDKVTSALDDERPYQVVLLDTRLPVESTEITLIQSAWSVDPNLFVVVCATDVNQAWSRIHEAFGESNRLAILKKPYDHVELCRLAATLASKRDSIPAVPSQRDEAPQPVDERAAMLVFAEEVLEEQKRFLELVTEVADVGYWRWDLESGKQDWSPSMFTILNADPAEIESSFESFVSMLHPKDRAIVRLKMDEGVDQCRPTEIKARIQCAGGEIRHILTKIVCEVDGDGETRAVLGVTRDVSRDEQAMHAVRYAALYDSLTDLANRTKFMDRLDYSLNLTDRYARDLPLVLIDLKDFQQINDTYGYPVGDAVLKQFAARLRDITRASDTLARLGGNEFAVLPSPVDQPMPVERLLERLQTSVDDPFEIEGHSIRVDYSCGISVGPNDGVRSDELLRNAQLALCHAKLDENRRYHFFEDAMDERVKNRRLLEKELKAALENDEFELHYQPVFDSVTMQVLCMEALLRWNHPERGIIAPSEFIEIAEETGLMLSLGAWVIRQACRDAIKLPNATRVAVNVSAVQFRDHSLVSTVIESLAAAGLAANRLELEITESVMLRDGEEILQQLRRLQDLGVRIALDDFGTGYSALSYLRSFQFDRLKIDRSLVVDATTEADAQAIVHAVASLGVKLGIETTAEGVETDEQLSQITADGYTHFQGFLRGRPAPLSLADHGAFSDSVLAD